MSNKTLISVIRIATGLAIAMFLTTDARYEKTTKSQVAQASSYSETITSDYSAIDPDSCEIVQLDKETGASTGVCPSYNNIPVFICTSFIGSSDRNIYQVGGATLTLNVVTMALGYSIATIAKLREDSVRAIAVEVGIQNGTLAIAIASTPAFLNNSTMAIPAGIYSLLMYFTGAAFAWLMGSRGVLRAN